jgi:hypothetical protein
LALGLLGAILDEVLRPERLLTQFSLTTWRTGSESYRGSNTE